MSPAEGDWAGDQIDTDFGFITFNTICRYTNLFTVPSEKFSTGKKNKFKQMIMFNT